MVCLFKKKKKTSWTWPSSNLKGCGKTATFRGHGNVNIKNEMKQVNSLLFIFFEEPRLGQLEDYEKGNFEIMLCFVIFISSVGISLRMRAGGPGNM